MPCEVRVVAARDPEDLAAVSQVMMRSFQGRENARLGPEYVRAVMRSFAIDPSRSLLVAWVGDRLVGFAAGEPTSGRAARYRALRPAAAAALMRRPSLLWDPSILRMALHRFAIDAETPSLTESWFLAIIGVDPELQGRGVGRQLLRAFEAEGCRWGFTTASLVVLESNASARAMYEQAGWHVNESPEKGRVCYEKPLEISRIDEKTEQEATETRERIL